jgi:uncharacterized UBP type Zn finger protein
MRAIDEHSAKALQMRDTDAPAHLLRDLHASNRFGACVAYHLSIRRMRNVCAPSLSTVTQPDNLMTCSHVDHIRDVKPSCSGCHDCVLTGDGWLQLRMCMECGYVGCCDASKNKHAIRHFRMTQHPIARSIEPGEEWGWCYVDHLWFEKLVPPARETD